MSKHNRDRRKWKRKGCGTQMHPELASPAATAVVRATAAVIQKRHLDPNVLHVCGDCKTFHKVVDDALVKLTPAELFKLHVNQPKTMARIEAMKVPRCTPGTAEASLVLVDEDSQ